MHKVLAHAIHRVVHRAIGKAAKSAAVSIYESNFAEDARNRSTTDAENMYDLTKPKDVKRLFQTFKTGWDEVSAEIETERQDEYKQESLWYSSLTPTQQKAIDASYRDGSYKFKKENRNNVPISPAQKRNIVNPQAMPLKLQAIRYIRTVAIVFALFLVLRLLFSLIY